MPDETRLERIERKLDKVVEGLSRHELHTEKRLTLLESARGIGVRWTGILWGIGGGCVAAFLTAWFSKHL